MYRTPYRLARGGLLALGAVLALGCEAEPEDEEDVPPAFTEEECPHDWRWTAAQKRNIEAFTGERDEVPGYNDCQRFLLGSMSNPSYGNVFAIFVADSVAAAHGIGDTPGDPAGPANGTEVLSSGTSVAPSAANGDEMSAVALDEMSAVALIAAWGDYEPLGIPGAGYYCLLMDSRPSPSAAIVRAGANADCESPLMSTRHDLFVFPRQPPPADVPGVVRWGFDGIPTKDTLAGSWVQYAIVPCGSTICYVGPTGPNGSGPGFTPKPPQAILASISEKLPVRGRGRVDLWHDTQFLADPGSSTGSTSPAASALFGVLIPDDELGNKTIEDFERGWVQVAEVAMSGSAYAEKFNFTATTGDAYNTVEICAYTDVSRHNCKGLSTDDMDTRCQADDPTDTRAWWAKHTSADSTMKYYCIEFIPPSSSGLKAPGTARWKWLADDEALWFRCDYGCCKDAV